MLSCRVPLKTACLFDPQQVVSICNIGNITSRLAMAKYLPMLPRGETV